MVVTPVCMISQPPTSTGAVAHAIKDSMMNSVTSVPNTAPKPNVAHFFTIIKVCSCAALVKRKEEAGGATPRGEGYDWPSSQTVSDVIATVAESFVTLMATERIGESSAATLLLSYLVSTTAVCASLMAMVL